MSQLTPGKLRGLQQIATREGLFTICALDHRGSMVDMVRKASSGADIYSEVVERKLELCSAVSPYVSGVLLDPEYGAAQCIAAGVLPGDRGLLVSVETSGYAGSSENRLTTLLDGWGVHKVKRLGASAVKLLVYYRPELGETALRQLGLVKQVAADCVYHDIPLLVEAVSYRIAGETTDHFMNKRSEIVIETAGQITVQSVDVLKAEFPAGARDVADDGELLRRCQRLSEVSRVPWVVLSGGVDYETFLKQVELACRGGASGFLAGRAIWQEAMAMTDRKERLRFLSTVVVDRVKRLVEVTMKYGLPWYRKLGLDGGKLIEVSQGWYRQY